MTSCFSVNNRVEQDTDKGGTSTVYFPIFISGFGRIENVAWYLDVFGFVNDDGIEMGFKLCDR